MVYKSSAADIQQLCPAVQMEYHTFGGNKDAVAFEKVEHKTVTAHTAAAVHTQKRMKTVGVGLKIYQPALDLRVEQHPLYLEILASGQQFAGIAVTVFEHTHRLSRCQGGTQIRYLQGFVDVQFSGVTVLVLAVVVDRR